MCSDMCIDLSVPSNPNVSLIQRPSQPPVVPQSVVSDLPLSLIRTSASVPTVGSSSMEASSNQHASGFSHVLGQQVSGCPHPAPAPEFIPIHSLPRTVKTMTILKLE